MFHDERLSKVFDALAKHHLTLNSDEFLFAAPAIEFVGFKLSTEDILPLNSNVEALQSIPQTNFASAGGFLSMNDGLLLEFLPPTTATTAATIAIR